MFSCLLFGRFVRSWGGSTVSQLQIGWRQYLGLMTTFLSFRPWCLRRVRLLTTLNALFGINTWFHWQAHNSPVICHRCFVFWKICRNKPQHGMICNWPGGYHLQHLCVSTAYRRIELGQHPTNEEEFDWFPVLSSWNGGSKNVKEEYNFSFCWGWNYRQGNQHLSYFLLFVRNLQALGFYPKEHWHVSGLKTEFQGSIDLSCPSSHKCWSSYLSRHAICWYSPRQSIFGLLPVSNFLCSRWWLIILCI